MSDLLRSRTTDQLLAILDDLAVAPTTTVYVWPNHLLTYPRDLLCSLCDYNFRHYERNTNTVYLPDTEARVRFVSFACDPRRQFYGHRNMNLVFDHACGEHVFTEAQYVTWRDVEAYLWADVGRVLPVPQLMRNVL